MQTILLVLTADPIRPRALQPKVPADLETICLKCLQKQPKKRYATAALLLEDVERFLAHCPIQARPSSMLERSVKWARRHPSASAWIATGAFAVVATLAGAWFHIDRLETELDRNGRLVSQSQEWGNWLVNVHIPEVAKLGGGNELQAQLVGKTLEHLRQLELDVSADRQLGEYIAQAYVHISEVQSDPAFATPERIEQALESYSRAASLYQELAANSTDSHLRLVQAKIFSAMSRLYISVNRAAEAEACIKQAFSQLQALDEQESVAIPELRLAHLRAQEQRLALTLPNLPPAEALEQLLQLYHACKALPLGIDDGGRHELIALCALQIAQLNPSSMGLDNASDDSPHTSTRFYQEAIDELRTLSVVDKRRERDLVIALDSLGRTYEQELEYDRAENVLRQAVDVQMRLINENPDSTNFQEQLLRLLERQFRVAQSARDFEQALTVAEEFVVRAEKIILTDPTRFRAEKRQAYTMCGVANRGLSRDDRAYECLERAEEVARSLASQSDAQEDWEELAKVLLQKSEVLVKRDQGRSIIVQQVRSLELAIHWLYEAMAIFERISQGTTSESESPYWQAVEAKNLMESELKNLKLRSRESTRPFQGGIDQE
jgi:tetratricopeptide (TPR) repeat protein